MSTTGCVYYVRISTNTEQIQYNLSTNHYFRNWCFWTMVCGKCGSTGHNSRTCKATEAVVASYRPKKPKQSKKKTNASKKKKKPGKVVDSSKLVYVLFDLETNGLSRYYNDIVEISASVLDTTSAFYSKCRPVSSVGYSEKIHGLSDAVLKKEDLFDVVGGKFMNWLETNVN